MSQHRSDTAKNRPLLSKRLLVLLLGFLYLLLSLTVLEAFRFRGEKPAAEAMREASERTAACFSAVKEERLRRGYEIPAVDDPNLTGLLGYDYTEITTSHGSLEAKRSTANPNTAAMITDFLLRSGVREGDPVCVNLSSSFPCLNIAVLCSLDTLGAKGVVINSIGASTYGANIPGFVYMDMEHLLFEKGLIRNHSQWFSMGGDYDTGYGMPDQKLAEEIRARIASYGPELLWYPDIRENLALNFDGDSDSMETYIEFEVMNHAIDQYNIDRDTAAEKLGRVKRLLKAPYFAKVQLQFDPDEDPEEYYIGSTGVSENLHEPLVIDWRSPVAETYYNQDNGRTFYTVEDRRIDVDLRPASHPFSDKAEK